MINKIWRAAIEGVLLSKITNFIFAELPKLIINNLDWLFGWLVRTIWSHFIKIEEEKIVFSSFNKQYTCNPKYICEEIIRRNLHYDLVWLTEEDGKMQDSTFPKCIRKVKIGTIDAYRELLSAKVIVQNAHFSQELGFIPKKKGQYYIQTWHGSLGIKRFDATSDSNKGRVRAAIRAGKLNDLFLSNSRFETCEVAPVFWKTSEICEWGHARNDILIHPDSEKISSIREDLFIPSDAKVALYAPTFRDNRTMEYYKIDFDKLISALEMRFGGIWIVLIKFHYSNRKAANMVQSSERIFNVSNYADIQELMLVADVGITDYSSWIYDYILMRRPSFLYAEDIVNYESERGFYYPLNTTPFPISSSSDELAKNIISFDLDEYKAKVEKFLEEKGCIEDGFAAVRAVERITQIIEN